MSDSTITGDRELDRLLLQLGRDVVGKVTHRSLGKGLTVLARAIRNAVPAAKTAGHGNASIKQSIGRRTKRYKRADLYFAKAGVAVGAARKKGAPHAHLIAMGTGHRYAGFSSRTKGHRGEFVRTRGTIAYRGYVKAADFVRRGLAIAGDAAMRKIREAFLADIDKEYIRLRGGRR
ncbi:MAG: hypothetical protein KDA76_12180 [Planctomycetaceae bacterium]|nr:hypothetical protein [Planctomycetaceae bacterium]